MKKQRSAAEGKANSTAEEIQHSTLNTQHLQQTKVFTKQDIHHKILAPFMTEYLTPIIPPILKLIGYDVEVLPMSDEVSAELGLKFANNEVCYPATLIVGDIIKADTFAAGDAVDVCGTSKGKGYAGVIKRFNAHSLKDTHGTGPVHRHAGSNGACSDPSRVMKGKKLPGHLGAERVTVQNLAVVKIDAENNLIAIKGAIPGAKGGIVTITDSVKA